MTDIEGPDDPIADLLAVPRTVVPNDGAVRSEMLDRTLRLIRRRRRTRRCLMTVATLSCLFGTIGVITVWRSPGSLRLSRYEVLRRAGDEHLRQPDALAIAIREYRSAVDAASDNELKPSPEQDTWLLAAIKTERLNAPFHDGDSVP